MRAVNTSLRPSLKSHLMIGAAGFAAVATSSAAYADGAPPVDAPKWQGFVELGAGGDNDSGVGTVNFFAPIKQDLDSMLFARVGVQTRFREDNIETLNVGYRQKSDDGNWIFGTYLGFDRHSTDLNNQYMSFSIGAEAMSTDWDFHLNAYVANRKVNTGHAFQLDIHDTFIGIDQQQEAAQSGFDGEVGYRIYSDGDTDLRLYAGGFDFDVPNKNFATKAMAGPKGGAELNIYDLDFIGPQSRLQFEGEVRHDDLRGTTEFIGGSLRIPLGDDSGGGAQALDELDRRMVDDIRRDDGVHTTAQFNKSEPVIIYNNKITSHATNTLFYVDNSVGEGSYADPTTLPDATTRPGPNQFIVLTDQEGSTVHSGGATIYSGETLVNGGETFKVRGVHSGAVFTHTFAPGSGKVTLDNPGGTVLYLDPNTNLDGFYIGGSFQTGIYGHNINNVVLNNITIQGDGSPGQDGIKLQQDSGHGTITIYNSSIAGVGNDGIYGNVDTSGGDHAGLTIQVHDTTITGSGGDGAALNTDASGAGSHSNGYLGIHDSTITGSGGSDTSLTGSGTGGGVVSQTIIVDPTFITDGYYGIRVTGYADSGSTVTQNVLIDEVTVSGTKYSGIGVYGEASGGGTLTQNVTISRSHVTGSYYPVYVTARAFTGGTVNQHVNMSQLTVTGGEGTNIGIYANAFGSGTTNQTVSMDRVTSTYSQNGDGVHVDAYSEYGTVHQSVYATNLQLNGNDGDGLSVAAGSFGGTVTQFVGGEGVHTTGNFDGGIDIFGYTDGGNVQQTVNLNNVHSTNNADDGVDVFGRSTSFVGGGEGATTYSGLLAQYVTITNATIKNNGLGGEGYARGTGVYASISARNGAAARQDVTIADSVISFNGAGADFDVYAQTGGSAEQHILLDHDTITHNDYGNAVTLGAEGYTAGFAQQTAGIYYSNLSGATDAGLYMFGYGRSGGNAEQHLYAYYDNISKSGADNVDIIANTSGSYTFGGEGGASTSYSHVTQLVSIGYDDLSHSQGGEGADGVFIGAFAGAETEINQYVYLGGDDIRFNPNDAIEVEAYADSGALLYSNVTTYNGTNLSHSGHDGFENTSIVHSDVDGYGGYLIQTIGLFDTTSTYNGNAGFESTAKSYGIYSFNDQTITLSGSTFDHNATGANFSAYENYGYLSFGAANQHVTIADSTFNHNSGDGLAASAVSVGVQGRTEQYFSVIDSAFDNNGRDGIHLYRYAGGGDYRNETGCSYAQGLYGGCAFVRQTFTGSGVDASYNGRDGINITVGANDYGAVYDNGGRPGAPTVLLFDSSFSHNGRNGMSLYNTIGMGSYGKQYVVAVDSQFDDNAKYGIFSLNEAGPGSYFYQTVVVYGTGAEGTSSSVSGNGHGGIGIITIGEGAYDVRTGLGVYYSEVTGNGGAGILDIQATKYSGITTQDAVLVGNVIAGNEIGAGIIDVSEGDFIAVQTVGSYYNVFAENAGAGLVAGMATEVGGEGGYTFLAQQSLTSQGDEAFYNGGVGIGQEAYFNSVYAYQYTTIQGDYLRGNGGAKYSEPAAAVHTDAAPLPGIYASGGIFVGLETDSYYTYAQHTITDNVVRNSTGDGITLAVSSYGYVTASIDDLSRNYVSGSTYDGIRVRSQAGYGYLYQSVELDDSTVIGNYHGGEVDAYASGGTVVQKVTADGLTAIGNTNGGFGFFAGAEGSSPVPLAQVNANIATPDSLVAQYVYLSNAEIKYNGGVGGLVAGTYADGLGAATSQRIAISDSAIHDNTYGINAYAHSSNGGSAQQYLVLNNVGVYGNTVDGLYMSGSARTAGFTTQQIVSLGQGGEGAYNSSFSSNGRDGISVNAYAYYGGNVDQNIDLFYATVNGNTRDGLHTTSASVGYQYPSGAEYYAYYSHVQQNIYGLVNSFSYNGRDGVNFSSTQGLFATADHGVILYYGDMSHNGRDGVNLTASATSYGAFHLTTQIGDSTLSYNGRDGVRQSVSGYADYDLIGVIATPRLYPNLYVNGDTITHNDGDGIHTMSYMHGGNFMFAKTRVGGTTADENGRSGFEDNTTGIGYYTYNQQNIYLTGSSFNGNGLDGARLSVYENFGPGSNGAATERLIYIAGSSFDGNGHDGLNAHATAVGYQGRAEQHFSILGSDFSYNTLDGMHLGASATDGYYTDKTCLVAQGLDGGCAFVRQSALISGSRFDYNGHDGVSVRDYANNYGAVYAKSTRPSYPTLQFVGSDLSYNGRDGLNLISTVHGDSYRYEKVVAVYTNFDSNGRNGITLMTNVDGDSAMNTYHLISGVPKNPPMLYLYGSSVSDNSGDGIHIKNRVTNGSYELQNISIVNSAVDGNQGFGVNSSSYVGSGGTLVQTILAYSYDGGAVSISNNGLGGVHATTKTTGEDSFGDTALYFVGANVSGNGGDGAYLGTTAFNDAFYSRGRINAYYSTFSGNTGSGINISAGGNGEQAARSAVKSVYNTFSANGGYGIHATMVDGSNSKDGASVFATQSIYSNHDTFTNNTSGALSNTATFFGGGEGAGYQFTSVYNATANNVAVGGEGGADAFSTTVNARNGALVFASADFDGNLVRDFGGDGIDVSMNSNSNAELLSYVFVDNNDVKRTDNGIYLSAHASGAPGNSSEILSYVEASGNTVRDTNGDGIAVRLYASGGYILNNYDYYGYTGVNISGNTALDTGRDGIVVAMTADQGGTVMATGASFDPGYLLNIYIDGNTTNRTTGDGIALTNTAENYSAVLSRASIGSDSANKALNAGQNGIEVQNYVSNGGYVVSEVDIENNTVTNANLFGISLVSYGHYAVGDALSFINNYDAIDGNTVKNTATFAGIGIADLGGNAAIINDDSDIFGNTVRNGVTGVYVLGYGSGVTQTFSIGYNNIRNQTSVGIRGVAFGAFFPASQTDHVYVYGNTMVGNTANYFFQDATVD